METFNKAVEEFCKFMNCTYLGTFENDNDLCFLPNGKDRLDIYSHIFAIYDDKTGTITVL